MIAFPQVKEILIIYSEFVTSRPFSVAAVIVNRYKNLASSFNNNNCY